MSDDLIERMARAMCVDDGVDDGVDPDVMMLPGSPWIVGRGRGFAVHGTPFPVWMSYGNLARAALAAILVPTEAMVKAGGTEVSGHIHEFDVPKDSAVDIWIAMIDAADPK